MKCTEKCDSDENCGSVECGGDHCSWWKKGVCSVGEELGESSDAEEDPTKICRKKSIENILGNMEIPLEGGHKFF